MSARKRSYTGRGGVPEPTGTGVKTDLASGAGRSPPPTGGSGGACGGVRSPRPTGATQVVPSSGPMYLRHGFRRPNFVPKFGASVIGIGPYALRGDGGSARRVVVPYGWLRRVAAIALGSGAQRSVCGADGRNGLKLRQRSPQKCLSKPDNPSVSLRLTAPFAQGSLGDEGCGLPRRFAPRNDSPDHSEEAQRADVGIRPFLRWTGVRAAEVVGPYGKPKPAGAQRSVRARVGEGWVEIGAWIIPKGASNAGQSLSHGEAVTAPFTQGSLGDGGCGLPRRPCGPPRNDSPDPLSFRGQCAHWTWESVLFTMDGGSGRRT